MLLFVYQNWHVDAQQAQLGINSLQTGVASIAQALTSIHSTKHCTDAQTAASV